MHVYQVNIKPSLKTKKLCQQTFDRKAESHWGSCWGRERPRCLPTEWTEAPRRGWTGPVPAGWGRAVTSVVVTWHTQVVPDCWPPQSGTRPQSSLVGVSWTWGWTTAPHTWTDAGGGQSTSTGQSAGFLWFPEPEMYKTLHVNSEKKT